MKFWIKKRKKIVRFTKLVAHSKAQSSQVYAYKNWLSCYAGVAMLQGISRPRNFLAPVFKKKTLFK